MIVETIKRIVADHKRSCEFALYIPTLINSKVGSKVYLLDRPHLPLQPELEDCIVTMDETHPTSAKSQAATEAAKNIGPILSTAPVLKMNADKIIYILHASQRSE